MSDVPWGTHICVFYESKADLLDTNAAYLSAGLTSNEFCVWIVSAPTTVDEAQDFLRREIADFDRYLAAGQVEILPGYEWYLPRDQFDSQEIIRRWQEKLDDALSKGFEGMRVSGNAFWMEAHRWEEFREYEHEVDQSLAGKKMIAICTYSLLASSAIDLLDVTRAHPLTVARRNGDWQYFESLEPRQNRQELNTRMVKLTPREREALQWIAAGKTSWEASVILRLSENAIDKIIASAMIKLNAVTRAQAVANAIRAGEVEA